MRILIIQTAFVGDVILITPLIKATKTLFQESRIDVLVIPQMSEILTNNPYINEIITFDKRNDKIKNFIKTACLLRKRNYDLALLPHSSFTTVLLTYCSITKQRVGFDRWLSSLLLTNKIPFEHGKHRIKKNLDLLSTFSDRSFSNHTELFPQENDYQKAEQLTSSLDRRRKMIAIAPGSIWLTKRWPERYYKTLTQQLVGAGFALVMIGSTDEKALCENILPSTHAINVAGVTSILESAAIIEQCDLMICNDSGAMHIANAVKTDVFVFFGPTVESIGYFPFRERDQVFQVNVHCRPCGSHGGQHCPKGHHICMEEIQPEFVLHRVIAHLEKE